MVGHGYKRIAVDKCVYIQRFLDETFVTLLLYVDDILIVGQDAAKISKLKNELS